MCDSRRRTKWILGNVQNNYRNMTEDAVDCQCLRVICSIPSSTEEHYARTHAYVGFLEEGLSCNMVRVRVRFPCDLRYESWS